MTSQKVLEKKVVQLEAECVKKLRKENERLRERLGLPSDAPAQLVTANVTASVNQASPAKEKIKLFQQLFRGREDVYPGRWENRKGQSGYSPACANAWDHVLCGKPVSSVPNARTGNFCRLPVRPCVTKL